MQNKLLKKFRRSGLVVLSLVVALSASASAFAYTGSPSYNTSLTYQRNSEKFVYSNCPEYILSSGGFTVEAGLRSGDVVTAQYYHIKGGGSANSVGILATNTNSKPIDITIQREFTFADYANNSQNADPNLKPDARMLKYFLNLPITSRVVTIPAKSQAWLIAPYSSPSAKTILCGRVQFKPTTSYTGGVAMKVVQCAAGTSATAAAKLSKSPITSDDENRGTTSGVYTGTQLTTTISSPLNKQFMLSAYKGVGDGTNELQTLSTGYTNWPTIKGNFGIIYTLKGLAGRTIKISPNFSSDGSKTNPAQFVYKTTATGSWQTTPIMLLNATSECQITIPSNGEFSYVLPGGNFGSVQVTVIK